MIQINDESALGRDLLLRQQEEEKKEELVIEDEDKNIIHAVPDNGLFASN